MGLVCGFYALVWPNPWNRKFGCGGGCGYIPVTHGPILFCMGMVVFLLESEYVPHAQKIFY